MNLARLRALAEAAAKVLPPETTDEARMLVEFHRALNPQTVLALLRIVEAAEAYTAAEQTISTWIEDGCGSVDVNCIRDAGDKRDAIAKALSDFRADPKATGVDGQGVGT